MRRLGELLAEHKDDLRFGVDRGGQVRSEGRGQGAGDDRHLRRSPSAVPLSSTADDRQRAPGHRHGSSGCCSAVCGHHGVQLPRPGVVPDAALARRGDLIWKPLDKSMFTALACDTLLHARTDRRAPAGASNQVVQAAPRLAPRSLDDGVVIVRRSARRAWWRRAGCPVVSRRGSQLGGNNAAIVAPSARSRLADAGIAFRRHGWSALHEPAPVDRAHVGGDELVGTAAKADASPCSLVTCSPTACCWPAIDGRRVDRRPCDWRGDGDGGEHVVGGEPGAADDAPDARYVARPSSPCPGRPTSCAPRRSARSVRLAYDDLDEAIAGRQNGVPRTGVEHLHERLPRGRASAPPTVDRASPTSTSARAAPRSVVRSVARSDGGGREIGPDAGRAMRRRPLQHGQLQPRPTTRPGRDVLRVT